MEKFNKLFTELLYKQMDCASVSPIAIIVAVTTIRPVKCIKRKSILRDEDADRQLSKVTNVAFKTYCSKLIPSIGINVWKSTCVTNYLKPPFDFEIAQFMIQIHLFHLPHLRCRWFIYISCVSIPYCVFNNIVNT